MAFWIIQAQENPPPSGSKVVDRQWRSNTLAKTLANSGHEVVRWRSSFSHQAKKQLVKGSAKVAIENYHHQYISAPGYRHHVGLSRILSHRALGRNFLSIAHSYPKPPKLIHVGNVPIELCYAAVRYGQEMGVPVIVDVRDLWPDTYADLIPDSLPLFREFVRRWLAKRKGQAGAALAGATGITAITKPLLEWGITKAGRSQGPDDAVFSMCYPKLNACPSDADIISLRKRLNIVSSDVLACHISNIGYQFDFEALIQSAKYINEQNPNVKFIIAGSGPALDGLKLLARDIPSVIFPGWLETAEVHTLMHLSTFGLIAHRSIPSFLKSLPNKFSEYLAGNLVICSSINGEMGRLIKTHKCGFVYDIHDPRSLSKKLSKLLKNPNQIQVMGQNSGSLHKNKFDGAKINKDFAEFLENIAKRGPL